MGTNDESLPPAASRTDDVVATIPLVEERLKVSKREVETGRVRVHVNVEERRETLTEQLSRDDVEVERIARNVRVSEIPNVRLEGGVTIVPVVEEVMIVEKALVLVEEIHIRRRTVSETVEVPVTIKSERARIERTSAEGSSPPASVE